MDNFPIVKNHDKLCSFILYVLIKQNISSISHVPLMLRIKFERREMD